MVANAKSPTRNSPAGALQRACGGGAFGSVVHVRRTAPKSLRAQLHAPLVASPAPCSALAALRTSRLPSAPHQRQTSHPMTLKLPCGLPTKSSDPISQVRCSLFRPRRPSSTSAAARSPECSHGSTGLGCVPNPSRHPPGATAEPRSRWRTCPPEKSTTTLRAPRPGN